MAVVYRTSAQTVSSGASPRTVSSTGVVSGDLVILCLCLANALAPTSIPSGFTLIASSGITDTPSIYLYSKVAGGSEPGTYSFSWASGEGEVGMLALHSDLSLDLVVDALGAQHNASGDRLWPSISLTHAASFLACFAAVATNTGTTPNAGMTERLDLANGLRVYLMTQALSSAGATGTRTGTGTASVSAAVSIAIAEQSVTAGLDVTLDAITLAAAGKVAIKGAVAVTLAAVTLSAAGLGPPPAPTDLAPAALTASSITIAWSYSGQVVNGFKVERSLTGVGSWSEIASVDADTFVFIDTGLAQNTTYYYRVRAFRS